jgi:hypothetical protein
MSGTDLALSRRRRIKSLLGILTPGHGEMPISESDAGKFSKFQKDRDRGAAAYCNQWKRSR